MAHTIALEVHDLTVYYQKHCALSNVSFVVPTGTLFAIAGPNGGGKTTLLRSILDLIPYTHGTITVLQETFKRVRSRVAYIPQRFSVDWDFPVSVNDVVMMGRYPKLGWFCSPGLQDRVIVDYALCSVGLSSYAAAHIGELSGGQQQRVFVARALAQEADILIFDEPFVGIDHTTERLIIDVLQLLRDEGKTIIVVHHDLQTLTEYFDMVLLLNKTIVACGAVQDICRPEYICAAYGNRTIVRPTLRVHGHG